MMQLKQKHTKIDNTLHINMKEKNVVVRTNTNDDKTHTHTQQQQQQQQQQTNGYIQQKKDNGSIASPYIYKQEGS